MVAGRDTNLPAAHLYHRRRARMCAFSHPHSIESRIEEACNELRLTNTYPGPPAIPPSVQRAHKSNQCKSCTNWLKPKVNDRWHFLLTSLVPAHTNPADHSDLPLTSQAQAYHRIRFHAPKANLLQLPYYLTQHSSINAFPLLRVRMQCHEHFSTHAPSYEETSRDSYQERLCNYCDQQALGNEIHILFHCPILKDRRDPTLEHISEALDTFDQPPITTLTDAQIISVLCGETPKSLPLKLRHRWHHLLFPSLLNFFKDIEHELYRV